MPVILFVVYRKAVPETAQAIARSSCNHESERDSHASTPMKDTASLPNCINLPARKTSTMIVFRRNSSFILLFLCFIFLTPEVSCQRAIVSLGKRLQNRFGRSQQKRPVTPTAGEKDTSSGRQNWSYIAVAVLCVALGGGQFSYRRRRAEDSLDSNDGEFHISPHGMPNRQ
jgi:hypothetical protein